MGEHQGLNIMLSYKIEKTNENLTALSGISSLAHLVEQINLVDKINNTLPAPRSNRGFMPSSFVISLATMLHAGGDCLDDLKRIRGDVALRKLLNIKDIPTADAAGKWMKRVAKDELNYDIQPVNTYLNSLSLRHIKSITLDIDATLTTSSNINAQWSYKKVRGYMPMVGHVAETGTILAVDFRDGNVSPKAENHEFIKRCENALPGGVHLAKLRADSAAYQREILDDLIDREIGFAIRAVKSQHLKQDILDVKEENWQPSLDRKGRAIEGDETTRIVHSMHDSAHAFTLIVQRTEIKGQLELDLPASETQNNKSDDETIADTIYMYRAIATNLDHLSNDEIVHWYNQRGESSENRIKDLKEDFGGDQMPCNDFKANALYFQICALAYNLFILLREALPAEFESSRAKKVRLHLYNLAGKCVQSGRQLVLKVSYGYDLLVQVINQVHTLFPAPT